MSQYPADPLDPLDPLDPRDHASPDPSASSSRDQPAPLPSDPTQPPHHAPTYTNPLAIGSLVSGVIGVMLTFMCLGSIGSGTRGRYAWPMTGGIAVLVAVVLGLIALSQIKAGKGGGRGLAIGGIICGIICGILVPLLLLVVIASYF